MKTPKKTSRKVDQYDKKIFSVTTMKYALLTALDLDGCNTSFWYDEEKAYFGLTFDHYTINKIKINLLLNLADDYKTDKEYDSIEMYISIETLESLSKNHS